MLGGVGYFNGGGGRPLTLVEMALHGSGGRKGRGERTAELTRTQWRARRGLRELGADEFLAGVEGGRR